MTYSASKESIIRIIAEQDALLARYAVEYPNAPKLWDTVRIVPKWLADYEDPNTEYIVVQALPDVDRYYIQAKHSEMVFIPINTVSGEMIEVTR